MPSHSEKQRNFFGLVRAVQKGEKPASSVSSHLREIANRISANDASAFASFVAELSLKKEVLNILKEIRNPSILNEIEENPIAKQFTVKDDFEKYAKRYIGQPFSPKELDALNTFQEVKPTKIDRIEIRFETIDDFSNGTTTIIKKMKDTNQFSFNAFTKHKKAIQSEPTDSTDAEPTTPAPTDKEDIIVSKSTLFSDDIKGSSILIEFLKKLDL